MVEEFILQRLVDEVSNSKQEPQVRQLGIDQLMWTGNAPVLFFEHAESFLQSFGGYYLGIRYDWFEADNGLLLTAGGIKQPGTDREIGYFANQNRGLAFYSGQNIGSHAQGLIIAPHGEDASLEDIPTPEVKAAASRIIEYFQ